MSSLLMTKKRGTRRMAVHTASRRICRYQRRGRPSAATVPAASAVLVAAAARVLLVLKALTAKPAVSGAPSSGDARPGTP